MSGANISRVKDAMVLILKSLQPGCLFNIIGFGSTFKPLFPTSQSYEEAPGDMGGTNILNPCSGSSVSPPSEDTPASCSSSLMERSATRGPSSADPEPGPLHQVLHVRPRADGLQAAEVLLSPVGNNFLFPGDSLIGIRGEILHDALRGVGQLGVFPLSGGGSSEDRRGERVLQGPPDPPEQDPGGCETSPRRRAYSTTQISDHHPTNRAFTPSDPCSVAPKNPLRRAKVQELVGQSEAQWRRDYQHPPGPRASTDQSEAPVCSPKPSGGDGSRSSSDSPSVGSLGDSGRNPQEVQASDLGSADCKAVVSGLLSGRPASWEVVFDIEPFLSGREREEKGPGRKYQLFAIHTSKSCNILSKHTAFVPIDLDTNEYLHTCIEYSNAGEEGFEHPLPVFQHPAETKGISFLFPGEGLKSGSRSSSRSGSRKNRGYSVGLGRSQSGGVSEDAEDFLINNGEDGASPCSTPSSAGWEHCSFTEGVPPSPPTNHRNQLALSRTRLLTRAAKGFMWRSHSKSGDSMGESDNENKDYIPLKLKWTSPFSSHRNSLAPQRDQEFSPSHDPPSSGSLCTEPQASASHFIEWELAAAKASTWLSAQEIPEGRDLESVKAAANQLSAQIIKNAPSVLKADIWTHYGFYELKGKNELDKSHAVCKVCHTKIKYLGGNTTNLRNHLSRFHCEKLTPATKKTADPAQRRIDETLSTFPPNSEKAKKITQSVAAFIAKDLRPYSVVENAGFRHLLKTLEPRYKLPSRSHFTENVIPALYNGTKAQVMASMIQAKRVAITCDAWTSVATESYLTVTAHYISEDWQFLSHVLQTRAVYESHTGAHVAELLSRVVEEWQLSDKDVVLVTDNASNMIAAAEFGKFPHVKCFAHTLNLASQRALKVATLSRLLGRDAVSALKPMKDATTLMSEESNPTVSLIAPINAQLFQDMTGTIGDSPMIHAIKNAIKTDLLKRYNSEAEKKILHTASALDPRFKGLPFLTVEERLEVYRGVTEEAASLENERTLRRTEVTEAPEGGASCRQPAPPPDPEPQPTNQKPPSAAPNPAGGDGSRSSSDSPSVGSLGDSGRNPQEVQASDLGSADCKAVVSGLLSGRPASWRSCSTSSRPGRKYQLFAIHTSKSCNILSKHTAFVPIDLDTNEYLHTCIEYSNAGEGLKSGPVQLSLRQQEEPRSGGVSEDAEDFLINNGEDGASPCSTPSSAGWEHCSFTEDWLSAGRAS
ncbi:hypothetical protein F7725_001459 [Dissostichus mawsoni]|uniref:BED-type domain-containing protein n=1 Tax=Dissostichus mawsoni TaxID=36200 RepID=A0A7J5ZHC0_DISMA|nr:hypothetical protein F7725_001459 [Dissostichus mawsoni]